MSEIFLLPLETEIAIARFEICEDLRVIFQQRVVWSKQWRFASHISGKWMCELPCTGHGFEIGELGPGYGACFNFLLEASPLSLRGIAMLITSELRMIPTSLP